MTYVWGNQLICDKMVNLRKRRPKLSLVDSRGKKKRKVAKQLAMHEKILDSALLLNGTVPGISGVLSRGITSAEVPSYPTDGDAHWELAPKLALPS